MTTERELRVTRRATLEIRSAGVWWRGNRPASPQALQEEIQRAFELLSRYPGIGARARNAPLHGVRRIHLSRVRYDLYYREVGWQVEILALWHSSRGSELAL